MTDRKKECQHQKPMKLKWRKKVWQKKVMWLCQRPLLPLKTPQNCRVCLRNPGIGEIWFSLRDTIHQVSEQFLKHLDHFPSRL